MIAVVARPALPTSSNTATAVVARRRRWTQSQPGHRHDAQRALRPDHQSGKVVAGHALDRPPAQSSHPAVRQHHLQAKDRIARDAVLHAAQAAGIGVDVAADGAEVPARRVGRVPESVLVHVLAQLGVHDARLCLHVSVHAVHVQDVAHALDTDHQGPVNGVAATGETRPGAAWHHRNPMRVRGGHHRRHLIGSAREYDGEGLPCRRPGGPVAGVGREDVRVGDDVAVVEHRVTCSEHRVLRGHVGTLACADAGDHRAARCRHSSRRGRPS